MTIIEPTAGPTARAVVPEQRRRERSAPPDPDHRTVVVIDHVSAHDVSCYWDHLDRRWRCAR